MSEAEWHKRCHMWLSGRQPHTRVIEGFVPWMCANHIAMDVGWLLVVVVAHFTLGVRHNNHHHLKSNDFRYIGAYVFTRRVSLSNVYLTVIHGIKNKTIFIGGMELVSLSCKNDFTSASSYGLGCYKHAITTQWHQFHTTDGAFLLVVTNFLRPRTCIEWIFVSISSFV